MKVCPICQAKAFDDAEICYGCLHPFVNEAKKPLPSLATSQNEPMPIASQNESMPIASQDEAKLSTSNDESKLSTSNDESKLATSHDEAKLIASQNESKLVTEAIHEKRKLYTVSPLHYSIKPQMGGKALMISVDEPCTLVLPTASLQTITSEVKEHSAAICAPNANSEDESEKMMHALCNKDDIPSESNAAIDHVSSTVIFLRANARVVLQPL